MPQTIQRAPVGLLGMLDSKAGGQNPSLLLDEVGGVIDLTHLYAARLRRSRTSNVPIAALVLGVNIPQAASDHMFVRDGEMWLVHAVTAEVTGNVLGTPNFSAGVIAGAQFYMTGALSASATAGGVSVDGSRMNPIWLLPGDSPAFFVKNFSAGVTQADFKLNVLFDLVRT